MCAKKLNPFITKQLSNCQKKSCFQSGPFTLITSTEFNRFDDSENAKNAD